MRFPTNPSSAICQPAVFQTANCQTAEGDVLPNKMMSENRPTDIIARRFNGSILVGVFGIAVLCFAGIACPTFAVMLEDFGFEAHWRHAVCSAVWWQWTLPLAMLLAGFLVWKVSRLSLRANRLTNRIALIGILVIAAAVLYTTVCFTIRGNTMTSPFGSFTAEGM